MIMNNITLYFTLLKDNISDITHSFLFSLNIFMSILQKEGISTVKVVPYLPVRYNSRALAAKEKDTQARQPYNQIIMASSQNTIDCYFYKEFKSILE